MGRIHSWFPADRQAVVLSDHAISGPRQGGEKGTAEHSEWGIFLVRSPLYQAGVKFGHLELLEIFPPMLALLGLPAGKDMPGRILPEPRRPRVPGGSPTWRGTGWIRTCR